MRATRRTLNAILPCIAAALLILTGCASSGFDRGALQERAASQAPFVDSKEIEKVMKLKPQLRFPFKLAVYLNDCECDTEWRWTPEDKKRILSIKDDLKDEGILSDVFLTPSSIAEDHTLNGIRTAAARQGADAVMIVQGTRDSDQWIDPSGVLNAFIVPGFIVPALHRKTLFVASANIWDVSNAYLYSNSEAESEAQIRTPTFNHGDDKSIDQAKTQALEELVKDVVSRIDRMK